MPNSLSAKKSLRQSERRRRRNFLKKKTLKATKKAAIASPSKETLSAAYKAIDKAVKTGLLKSTAAARKKSRLAKATNKTGASS